MVAKYKMLMADQHPCVAGTDAQLRGKGIGEDLSFSRALNFQDKYTSVVVCSCLEG